MNRTTAILVRPLGLTVTLLAAVSAGAGCESSSRPTNPGASPPPVSAVCPDVTGASGSRHAGGLLERDETWTAKDGPHWVDGTLTIEGGATLTVEPCVEIRMASGASLRAGAPSLGDRQGSVVLRGEADAPIRVSGQGQARWGALAAFAPAKLSLRHVQVEGGGADPEVQGATVYGGGRDITPLDTPVLVEGVRVAGGSGPGVVLEGAAAFDPASRDLQIQAEGSEALPFPVVVGAHALGSVPSGRYAGGKNTILVRIDSPNALAGLQVDTTIRDRGVPYLIGSAPGEGLRVGANGGPPVDVTIEAGVELRFQKDAFLRVVSDADKGIGRLAIEGTAEAPVRLTSASATPQPGDWAGLYFESPMREHSVRHADVSFAGGYCSCSLSSCSPLSSYDAAVILDGRPPSVFFRDSTIRKSGGHGFLRSWEDGLDLDFAESNSFADIVGCAQTVPVRSSSQCPDAADACM